MPSSPFARDLELYVRCRSCGFPLATGVRRLPGEEPPDGRAHRCPRCGAFRTYGRADYVREDELAAETGTRK